MVKRGKHVAVLTTREFYRYIEPVGDGIRCDSGVREGSEISVYYDPMICKLVTYGKTRMEAINLGKTALDSYVIQGVSHNIPLLRDILTEVMSRKCHQLSPARIRTYDFFLILTLWP